MTLRTLPCKPEEWARIAVTEKSWLHAYKVAKSCANEILGKEKDGPPNPHAPYWKRVIAWIEKNAPPKALEEEVVPMNNYETNKTNPIERGKAMRVTEVKYTRRVNNGNYEHEEYALVAVLEEDGKTDHIDAMTCLKADVQTVISGESAPAPGPQAGDTKEGKGKGKNSKKPKPAPTTAPSEEEEVEKENEEETEETTEETATEEETEEETETESEEETEEETEEEDPAPAKPAKTATAGAKAGKKGFKKKPQTYLRANLTHKSIFSATMLKVAPNWKKSFESKAHAKKVSQKMEGKEFLNEDGKVIASFETELKKAMGKFAK